LGIGLICKFVGNKKHGNTTLLLRCDLHGCRHGYGNSCLPNLSDGNQKGESMTHSLYLSIIGAVVFLTAYIILRLLRDNERLIVELHEAKAKARTLDADLSEARRSNRKANAHIEQLKNQLVVMGKKLPEYHNEAIGYKIRINAVMAEHRKTIQQLYGRIGAMQRQINRLKSLP
jgi:hypothetical protein